MMDYISGADKIDAAVLALKEAIQFVEKINFLAKGQGKSMDERAFLIVSILYCLGIEIQESFPQKNEKKFKYMGFY